MTIELKIEVASSAKGHGFQYVRSANVAVVSIIGERSEPSTPLRAVLQACFARFDVFLREWLRALPYARVLLFAATPFSDRHNALSRRRGIWGIDALEWLPASTSRSPSVEISREDGGSRFVGLAEIPVEHVFEAADFARTHGGSLLLLSSRGDLTEERVRSTAASVFPKGESAVDWASAVSLVEEGEDICIRASGGFDDREASLDAFLREDLRRKLGSI
jgi:hypothetical protein